MLRRRLLSLVGAVGLVAGLISSGVAAQAGTPGPDWTYSSLLATYLWSSQGVCYSNGTYQTVTNPCVIVQGTPAPGKSNIAVCVQVASADQQCDITQTNDSHNNYALVIQRVNQQGAAANCPAQPPLQPPIPPCQNALQRASILQTATLTGSNFGGVIQKVTQSLTEQATDDDPGQNNEQDVKSLTATSGLMQTSGSGSNFAAVGQDSRQSQAGAKAQSETARQFAGISGSSNGINQTTAAPGGNAALLGQVQKQNLQSQVALNQTENGYQDGDINQLGAPGTNFASGNQFQNQQEQGPPGTSQHQLGDPKCCSAQNGGQFDVNQATVQFGNVIAPNAQLETLIGNCFSPPPPGNTNCHVNQLANQNGVQTPNSCSSSFCQATITCGFEGACVPTSITTPPAGFCPPPGFGAPCILGAVALANTNQTASASGSLSVLRSPTAARSAPMVALLT
jgi:hypothetical protein